jgi:hypothetical protein
VLLWHIGGRGRLFGPAFAITPNSLGVCGMDWPEYLRDQAAKYRQLAEKADDPVVKTELLEPITSSKAGGLIGNRQRRF